MILLEFDPCYLLRQQLHQLDVKILPGEPKNPEHYYSVFEIHDCDRPLEDLIVIFLQPVINAIAHRIKNNTSTIRITAPSGHVSGTECIHRELLRVSVEYNRQLGCSGPGYIVQYSCLVEEI